MQYDYRLRHLDVKTEHSERSVQRAEQERDQMEEKYNSEHAKYVQIKEELDTLVRSMEGL